MESARKQIQADLLNFAVSHIPFASYTYALYAKYRLIGNRGLFHSLFHMILTLLGLAPPHAVTNGPPLGKRGYNNNKYTIIYNNNNKIIITIIYI